MPIATTKFDLIDRILLIVIVSCGCLNFAPDPIGIIALLVGYLLLFALISRWTKNNI